MVIDYCYPEEKVGRRLRRYVKKGMRQIIKEVAFDENDSVKVPIFSEDLLLSAFHLPLLNSGNLIYP